MQGRGIAHGVYATVFLNVIFSQDGSHDYDRKMPRTPAEIYELNRGIAGRMEEIFTKRGVPVVPSLGTSALPFAGVQF
jgi:hypothetical protein